MAEGHRTEGRHILLDVWGVGYGVLNDLERIRSAMLGAAEAAGATVVDTSFHRFPIQGLSGVVVLSESHISVHTFPEHDYAAFDIFTCGAHVDPERGADFLVDLLGADRCFSRRFMRGGATGIEESQPAAVTAPGSL
jgi:S-adenosylmethionine decarboxylase